MHYTLKNTNTSVYWQAVQDRAKELESDGCTWATELFHTACLEHDIHYRQHKDLYGIPITKLEADTLFWERMRQRSWLGKWSPIAYGRYKAVCWFGTKPWNHT